MPLVSRMKSILSPLSPKYKIAARLIGHHDAVLSLAVSQDGLLASGGMLTNCGYLLLPWLGSDTFPGCSLSTGLDGVRLWTFPQGKSISGPSFNLATRGPVTCVAWVPFEKPSLDILIFGTTSGYLCIWSRDDAVRSVVFA